MDSLLNISGGLGAKAARLQTGAGRGGSGPDPFLPASLPSTAGNPSESVGFSMVDTLRVQIRSLNQTLRNANEGIGFLQTADGALVRVQNILTQAAALIAQAASAKSPERLLAIRNKLQELFQEIERIGATSRFKSSRVFSEQPRTVALDSSPGGLDPSVDLNVGEIGLEGLGIGAGPSESGRNSAPTPLSEERISVLKERIETGLARIEGRRRDISQSTEHLERTEAALENRINSLDQAESQSGNRSPAREAVRLTEFQISADASTAFQAQANLDPQSVLKLFRSESE